MVRKFVAKSGNATTTSRRECLRFFGSAAAGLVLGGLMPVFGRESVFKAPTNNSSLEEVSIIGIEVESSSLQWVGETKMMSPILGLINLFQYHNLDLNFKNVVGYCEASQCLKYFQMFENDLRKRYNHDLFTDVKRSTTNRDIAYLIGGNFDYRSNRWLKMTGSTQYQNNPAVELIDDDASVLLTGAQIYKESYAVQPNEVAKCTTVISNPEEMEMVIGNQTFPGGMYSTPQSKVFYSPRPTQYRANGVNHGIVAVRKTNSPVNEWKAKRIYM